MSTAPAPTPAEPAQRTRRRGYARVSNATCDARLPGAGALGKLVMLVLFSRCYAPSIECRTTVAALIEATDESASSVSRAIARLKELGYLEVRRGGDGRPATFKLLTLRWEPQDGIGLVGRIDEPARFQPRQIDMADRGEPRRQPRQIDVAVPFQPCHIDAAERFSHVKLTPVHDYVHDRDDSGQRRRRAGPAELNGTAGGEPETSQQARAETPRRATPTWLRTRAAALAAATNDDAGHPGDLRAFLAEQWWKGAADQARFLILIDQVEELALAKPLHSPAGWFKTHFRIAIREEQRWPGTGKPPHTPRVADRRSAAEKAIRPRKEWTTTERAPAELDAPTASEIEPPAWLKRPELPPYTPHGVPR